MLGVCLTGTRGKERRIVGSSQSSRSTLLLARWASAQGGRDKHTPVFLLLYNKILAVVFLFQSVLDLFLPLVSLYSVLFLPLRNNKQDEIAFISALYKFIGAR
jgi:hypothetical protein